MTSILLSYRDAISRDARSRIRERIRRPVKFHWRGARALRRALWRQSPYLGDVDTRWKPPSFFFFFLRQSSFERKKVKEIRLLLEIIPWKESPFSFFFELFFQPPDILFPFQIFFRVATWLVTKRKRMWTRSIWRGFIREIDFWWKIYRYLFTFLSILPSYCLFFLNEIPSVR